MIGLFKRQLAIMAAFAHQIKDIQEDPIYNAFPSDEQFGIQFDDVVKLANKELKYEAI